MTARVLQAKVTDQPLDQDALLAEVNDDRCGAVASFLGVVRNHDHGEDVDELEYSKHPSADHVIAEIAAEFAQRPGVHEITLVHRVGKLQVGDIAMVAIVASEHRGAAFSSLSEMVDQVKARLPIWKKQKLSDGDHEWVGLNG